MTAQSRRMALIEATTNVVLGYVLAVTTQIMVFPWFGLHPSLEDLCITGIPARDLRWYSLPVAI